MPQITYIDTESPRRGRKSTAAEGRRLRRFWKSVAALLLRHRVLLLLLFAGYRFVALGTGEMQQWDESIYALRTQAVFHFGAVWDQSPFMLGGTYYSAHPPLYVWCSTALLLLFGDHLWVYRLTSALAGALMVPLLYRLSRLLQPTLRSLAVTGLFAVLPLAALYSRLGQLDLLLTLCMTAALFFAIRAVHNGRAADTLLAGASLGAALMTKLLFALAVPAGVALSALAGALLPGTRSADDLPSGTRHRLRGLRVGVLVALIALPLWLPWAWSFAMAHGGGPSFLFSPSLPLGATFAGLEGSAKDTGAWYYLNQLVVNLSLLLPFTVYSLWRSMWDAGAEGWRQTAATALLVLAAIWVMGSSFEVYLIPVLPLLLLHAVHGMALLRRASRGTLLAAGLAAAALLPWSLFHGWRVGVKETARAVTGAPLPPGAIVAALALLAATAVAVGIVWLLHRRNRLRALLFLPLTAGVLLALAASTAVRIWIVAPAALDDGAATAAHAVRASDARRVFLVGNGENPQLTFYLEGADIGWVPEERLRFERLEPRALGVDGIRARIATARQKGPVAVLVERDEIAQGAYDAVRDVLPPGVPIRLRSGRYTVAGDAVPHSQGGDPQ